MKKSELRKLVNEEIRFSLREDKNVKITLICTKSGRVDVTNAEARSADIRKGDIIKVYRENNYFYFGSPIIKSGMKFMHDPGLSGKKIKNKFPNTSGLEVAIDKSLVGYDSGNDFFATFKIK